MGPTDDDERAAGHQPPPAAPPAATPGTPAPATPPQQAEQYAQAAEPPQAPYPPQQYAQVPYPQAQYPQAQYLQAQTAGGGTPPPGTPPTVVPSQQVPPPSFPVSGMPSPTDPPPRKRRRGLAVTVSVLGAVVALALAAVGGAVLTDNGTGGLGAVFSTDSGDTASTAPATGDVSGGTGGSFDLRRGAVFVQSNDAADNQVVAMARGADGRLTEAGRFSTGGVGSGSFEDTSHGIVLGTADGESSPQQNIESAQLLFVTNAGSNSISTFRVDSDGLTLISTAPSGGETPVGLTVNRGRVVVLNNGEVDDRFVVQPPDTLLENCTTGNAPTVSGLSVDPLGKLTPIANSTRPLSGGQKSGCAQVSFTPDGQHLVTSERTTSIPGKEPDRGALTVFDANANGTLGRKQVVDPSGVGPFGFGWTKDGTLISTEQTKTEDGAGTTSSYSMDSSGQLRPISRAVANGGTDSCWVVSTKDGKTAFVSNALGDGSISSYRVDENGGLSLLEGSAAEKDDTKNGTFDIGLDRDSKYLYQLNSHYGFVAAFKVEPDGGLTLIDKYQLFAQRLPEDGGQLTAFGLASI